MNEFLMRILIFAMDINEVFRLKKQGSGAGSESGIGGWWHFLFL